MLRVYVCVFFQFVGKKEFFYLICCCLILDKEDKIMQFLEKLREVLLLKEVFIRIYLVLFLFFFKFSSGILVCFKRVFENIKKFDQVYIYVYDNQDIDKFI